MYAEEIVSKFERRVYLTYRHQYSWYDMKGKRRTEIKSERDVV